MKDRQRQCEGAVGCRGSRSSSWANN